MNNDEFKAKLLLSITNDPLVMFDPSNLYWSQDHADGKVCTYDGGQSTFINKVEFDSLQRICKIRIRTPSYGYFILNIWQKDIIEGMRKIGFSIEDADYYMIDRGNPVEIATYNDTDIQFNEHDSDASQNIYTDLYLYSRSYKYGQEIDVIFYKCIL